MLAVQTNVASLAAQKNLRTSSGSAQAAAARLSSGLRINTAKDDAAGLGIAQRMAATLRGNHVVLRGINDGISLVQVAEGATISDLVQRGMELATQAANGSLSDADRAFVDTESKSVLAEIDRVAAGTTIFGKQPLAALALAPAAPAPPADSSSLGTTSSFATKFGTSGVTLSSQPSGLSPVGFIPAGATNVTIAVDCYGADDDLQVFSANGVHLVGTPVLGPTADFVWTNLGLTSAASVNATLVTPANGFNAGAAFDGSAPVLQRIPGAGEVFSDALGDGVQATYNGMAFTYTGDGDLFSSDPAPARGSVGAGHVLERFHVNTVTEPLFVAVVGSGSYGITATWDTMPTSSSPAAPASSSPAIRSNLPLVADIVVSADSGEGVDLIDIDRTSADTASLGLSGVSLASAAGARSALDSFQAALKTVSTYRSNYGALANRFDVAISNVMQSNVNVASARSRIQDVDVADAAAEQSRSQILQQAGTFVLAGANKSSELALRLLT